MKKISVGIIGCGYWGPNLIRNFSACPRTEVSVVCDASAERLEKIKQSFGHLNTVTTVDEMLDTPGLQAVAIATPVSTHFALAKRCLEAGLHVMVEKPLAASTREAQTLVDIAAKQGRVLMVDHTYLFSNSVRKIKDLIENDWLGELFYIDSIRINLGLFRHDVNVVWDLAPHDLAIVDYVLGHSARSISAWGCAHADPNIEDIAYVNVDYGDHLMASFHINWLSPVKIRQMIFAGRRKSLIFNELNTSEPVKLFDRGIDVAGNTEEEHRLRIGYRSGDIWSPNIEQGEPLQAAVSHFAECITSDIPCVSDGKMGVRTVQLLEAATRSIRAQGGRIALTNATFANGNGNTNGNGSTRTNWMAPGFHHAAALTANAPETVGMAQR